MSTMPFYNILLPKNSILASLRNLVLVAAAILPLEITAKVSGVDDRIDAAKTIGAGFSDNILSKARLTGMEQAFYDRNIGALICGADNHVGTVTLVRKSSGPIFVGSAHVILPYAEEKKLQSDTERREVFLEYAKDCVVVMTDKHGNVFLDDEGRGITRYGIDVDRLQSGTYAPGAEPDLDWIAFAIKPRTGRGRNSDLDFFSDATPIDLIETPRGVDGLSAELIAYHEDVLPEYEKIRSVGAIREFVSGSPLARRYPRSKCTNIDSRGWSSGGLITNKSRQAFLIHRGGDIPKGVEADCSTSGNEAIPVTRTIIHAVGSL